LETSKHLVQHRSIATILADITWVQSHLTELHITIDVPKVYYDNLGIDLTETNPMMHSHSKHFELDRNFVRERVQQPLLQLIHLPTYFQVVDDGVAFMSD